MAGANAPAPGAEPICGRVPGTAGTITCVEENGNDQNEI